ncbi:MAG TPA: DnaJ domain-containing protein, partial [Kofleriaceae bacterium]|nr:DnaJ domain-containing protein [Kofleriaceae bacterium]
ARTTTYRGPRRPRAESPRTRTISSMPPPDARQGGGATTSDVIAAGIARVDAGADHFALFGLPRDATIDSIRAAYVALACHLHPDRRPELEPAVARDAQRLLARVNLAFGVLGDPVRRADYLALLRREDGARPRPEDRSGPRPAGTATERARAAAEVAQRGMHALRRQDLLAAIELLTRATELAPHDVDYGAQLAWARFCASADRPGIAADVRRALERAIHRSPRPVIARFYLGRVERMLGRVREALHHFHEVRRLEPEHADAAAEIRLLEPRTARR